MPIGGYYKGDGEKVMHAMQDRYGEDAGKRVFYATANKRGMNPKRKKKATGHHLLNGQPRRMSDVYGGQ